MASSNGMNLLRPVMEDQDQTPQGGGEWPQHRHQQQHYMTQTHSNVTSPSQSSTNLALDSPRDDMERPSTNSLRSAFRGNASPTSTTRAVTPDLAESLLPAATPLDTNAAYVSRAIGSQQGSPRSVRGSTSRRQGIVFNDSFEEPYGGSETSPPPPGQQRPAGSNMRPRTRTMDTAMLAQRSPPVTTEQRHRVSSVSSTNSQPVLDEQRSPPPAIDLVGHSALPSNRVADSPAQNTTKEKRDPVRRLLKRQNSPPASPLAASCPSVDSLPIAIPTEDPNQLVALMRSLCGRMKGEVYYQGEFGGPWQSGVAYIDDEKEALQFDPGHAGSSHSTLIPDLRGCRVLRVDYSETGRECLELVSVEPYVEILLAPQAPDELDLWLAALLSWQQIRPPGIKLANGGASTTAGPIRPELKRQGKSLDGSKPSNIIKVGNVLLWDKGPAPSARAIVHRSSTRDLRSPVSTWKRVSCILQENGDFKLLAENDVAVLSVIELSQLSRCAIQSLDRSVLNEDFCIAIFPIYASTSSRLSIFRPVYLALESRVHFEVWFVLLRAFAVPDIYQMDNSSTNKILEVSDLETEKSGEVFRVEKTLSVRVTEAKLKARPTGFDLTAPEKGSKADQDPLIGSYVAEVILDGEVRARTSTKTATKNPFWREDCEFGDLPATIQQLSIVLKRVEGNPDTLASFHPPGSAAPSKTGGAHEVIYGTVNIHLDRVQRGKDLEEWLKIMDSSQQVIGSMLIRVTHQEHIALLSEEYKPLAEILHRLPTGLTAMISAALPGQLRRVSEQLLNIFQASDTAADWLMALVEDEIDGIGNQTSIKKYRFSSRLKSNESMDSASASDRELIVRDMSKSLAGEANLLFRGNTLLTQALEFHMRRLGQEYLEDTLRDKICEINEFDPDCEVDPAKVHHAGGDLEQHWSRLLQITSEIWQCIVDSAHQLPTELRHILKYIRAVAEDRYGDFLRTAAYTSVSGFLFLRFICPAILSPKLFGLLPEHPRLRTQRTLTLVAKALQKMSNLSTFGKREEWMEPMNKFLTTQRPVFRDYIDRVSGIPAERGVKAVPASYSTPITIMGRLGPTAREGFPSLPYLIDDARSLAGLVKLWVEHHNLDSKSEQVDGELLIFHSTLR